EPPMAEFWSKPLLWFLPALASLAAVSPVSAQVATVTVKSVNALLYDCERLALWVGQEQRLAQVKAWLQLRTGDRGLDGVDGRRVLGAYLVELKKFGDLNSLDLPAVFFLPVVDEKRFVKLLEQLDCRPRPLEGGMYRVTVRGGPDLFLRFANRYAYAST